MINSIPHLADLKLSLIVAIDRNGLIGYQNHIPWRIPEDLAYFREKTLNHTVIMGKNTWMSLGSTLDQRVNIILTHDHNFYVPGAIVCHSVSECLEHCRPEDEVFVIGGSQIFKLFLPLISKMYVTRIDAEFEGDTWFPEINWEEWELIFFEQKKSKTGYMLTFSEYVRKNGNWKPELPEE